MRFIICVKLVTIWLKFGFNNAIKAKEFSFQMGELGFETRIHIESD